MLFFTASDFTSITVTSTTGCCFCFGSVSSFFLEFFYLFLSSSILGTYCPGEFIFQPGEFIFQYHIFLPFHTVHGVLKARIPKWFAIPFSSGPYFVRTLYHDPSVLGGSTCKTHSFIELDKAMIQVISLFSFLYLWFTFCLSFDG